MPGITRVSDLLNDAATGWDRHKLEAMFTEGDVHDTLRICVGGLGTDDFLAWNFTKNGIFMVKSAYHLRMSLNRARTGQPKASSSIGIQT